MADVEAVYAGFIGSVDKFVKKLEKDEHEKSKNIAQLAHSLEEINATRAAAMIDKLEKINSSGALISRICEITASFDVESIAMRMDISDTSRGVLAQTQRDIIDMGGKLLSIYSATVNRLIKTSKVDVAQVMGHIRAHVDKCSRADQCSRIGSVFMKVIRAYAPFMSQEEREEMHSLLLEKYAASLLGSTTRTIRADIPLHEQVLTSGSLVPLFRSLPRDEFFELFEEKYDTKRPLSENLERLARAKKTDVVFVSKIGGEAIEFDSRALFDSDYVREHELMVPQFLGICDKTLARYNTVGTIAPCEKFADAEPYYGHWEAASKRSASSRVIIVESLAHGTLRQIGNSHESTTRAEKCRFLVEGQTTRAREYNMRIEDAIIAHRTNEAEIGAAHIAVEKYLVAKNDASASGAFASQIEIGLLNFLSTGNIALSARLFIDISDVVATAMRGTALQEYSSQISILWSVTSRISKLVEPFLAAIMSARSLGGGGAIREQCTSAVSKIMQTARDEELFIFEESIYSYFAHDFNKQH